MLVARTGLRLRLDPPTRVASTAILCGDVRGGAGCAICHGAVLKAGRRFPLPAGSNGAAGIMRTPVAQPRPVRD